MDILEVVRGRKIIVAIDYFTRKIFAKENKTDEATKVVEMLKNMHKEFPIKCLLTDNGRELKNKQVEEWARENNVELMFAIPYHHQSNGRVERANRTIRNGLRKEPGPLRKKLQKVVAAYNETIHRGIGMSPNSSINETKWVEIRKYSEEYKKEFDKVTLN